MRVLLNVVAVIWLLPGGGIGNIIVRDSDYREMSGGATVTDQSYPFMVRFRFRYINSVGRCGGSLINKRYILTALHCFTSFNADCLDNGQPNGKCVAYLGDRNTRYHKGW